MDPEQDEGAARDHEGGQRLAQPPHAQQRAQEGLDIRAFGTTPSIIPPMKPKVPWLPAEVQPGQKTETCARCGANKMIPWTLKRDPQRIGLLRTWVCTACQLVEERAEAED